MTEIQQAAAVEAPVSAVPDTQVSGAQEGSDLASFLDEYERTAGTPQPAQPEPKVATDETSVVVELKNRLDSLEGEKVKEKNDRDFADAVKQIKGDLDVPEFIVKGWLLDQAKDKKAVDKIWDNRDSNPAAFKQMIARMNKDFAATTSKVLGKQVDANATEDTLAVAHAVRGASTKVPESRATQFRHNDSQRVPPMGEGQLRIRSGLMLEGAITLKG
jgi:hypothetical protein